MNGIPDWCEQAAWNIAKRCEESRAAILNLSILPDAPVRCWGPEIIWRAYCDWQARGAELDLSMLPPTDEYGRDLSG